MYNLVVSGWLYIEISDTQLLEDQKNAKPNWKANCVWCHMWQSSKRGTLCGKNTLSEGWEPFILQHVQTKLIEKNKSVPLSLPSFINLIIHSPKELFKINKRKIVYLSIISTYLSPILVQRAKRYLTLNWFRDSHFPLTTSFSPT